MNDMITPQRLRFGGPLADIVRSTNLLTYLPHLKRVVTIPCEYWFSKIDFTNNTPVNGSNKTSDFVLQIEICE